MPSFRSGLSDNLRRWANVWHGAKDSFTGFYLPVNKRPAPRSIQVKEACFLPECFKTFQTFFLLQKRGKRIIRNKLQSGITPTRHICSQKTLHPLNSARKNQRDLSVRRMPALLRKYFFKELKAPEKRVVGFFCNYRQESIGFCAL